MVSQTWNNGIEKTGNLIIDPQTADRGIYTEFIGYFAVTPWNNYYVSTAASTMSSTSTMSATLSNDTIEFQKFNTVSIGMTYKQVIDVLGHSGVDVGYGAILYQYTLDNGQIAILNYCKNATGDLILCNIIYE